MKNKKNPLKSIDTIMVYGAREHNLKNVTVSLPKNQLTVITGPSGSGKSSLALDVLFVEGKRRYIESLSAYARQFLGISKKPEVDRIDGLCPAIAIEQKTVGSNPRSTVGTITEIYDYFRVLYARVGKVLCPDCKTEITKASIDTITDLVAHNHRDRMVTISAPFAQAKKGEFVQDLISLFGKGYYRVRIDGIDYKFKSIESIKELNLKKTQKHTIEVFVDALTLVNDERSRLQEAIANACSLAHGMCKITVGDQSFTYSLEHICLTCGQSFPELEPRLFSFNSPMGACKECEGIGTVNEWPWEDTDENAWKADYPEFFGDKYATVKTCVSCEGKRLNRYALSVMINEKDIYQLSDMPVKDLVLFFDELSLSASDFTIAQGLLSEIKKRLSFINDVGLSYLTLNRTARTLSGGEGQRIRLATQIGSALSGVLYVLDEPSIGLHQRDNDRLIDTLKKLRDGDNTVVVVEHDIDTIINADYVIDMGPAAGVLGGEVTAVGSPEELKKNKKSLTGAYLRGDRSIMRTEMQRDVTKFMVLKNAHKNNLKNITVQFPLGVLCGVSGVSGSGKSTLVMNELVSAIKHNFGGGYKRSKKYEKGESDKIEGVDTIDCLVVIDQTPIGRTSRSNPATYLGIFDDIRALFASLPESNARGYTAGRFSFNVAGGRCSVCSGEGTVTVEMHFLPAVTTVCKMCKGKRYNSETLSIVYKSKSIADVLYMTAFEALTFFQHHKLLAKRLQLLCDVGLDYVKLGQPSTTLSGGEAQRIKLVDELAKRGLHTLYILDEPTTGLHNSDIEKLLLVLNRLVNKNNSMIVIEHNIDVLKVMDYLIDLGPEGGQDGGYVVATGTPEQVADNSASHTGFYIKKSIEASMNKDKRL